MSSRSSIASGISLNQFSRLNSINDRYIRKSNNNSAISIVGGGGGGGGITHNKNVIPLLNNNTRNEIQSLINDIVSSNDFKQSVGGNIDFFSVDALLNGDSSGNTKSNDPTKNRMVFVPQYSIFKGMKENLVTKRMESRGVYPDYRQIVKNSGSGDGTRGMSNEAKEWEVFDTLNRLLARSKYKRHNRQIESHIESVSSLSRLIFKTTFDKNKFEIARRLRQGSHDDICPFLMIVASRRFGKSTCIAILAAACVLSIPSFEISVFSASQRQVGELMQKIRDVLLAYPEYSNFRVEKNNEEKIILINPAYPLDRRIIGCYPCREETVRGIDADLAICEEFAFIPERFFLAVVVPLLQKKNTALICITSPQGSTNHATRYSQIIDDSTGKKLFKTKYVQTICEDCKVRGFKGTVCPCLENELPEWIGGDKRSLIRNFYKGGNEDLMEQEMDARMDTEGNRIIKQEDIKYARELPLVNFKLFYIPVYIAMDTASSGKSLTSILAVAMDMREDRTVDTVIIDADVTSEVGIKIQQNMLRDMCQRIVNHPYFKKSNFNFICENNFGNDAGHMSNYFMYHMDVNEIENNMRRVISTQPKEFDPGTILTKAVKPGHTKTNKTTKIMKDLLEIAFNERRIRFCDAFMDSRRLDGKWTIKDAILDQASRFKAVLTPGGGVTYNAKEGGSGINNNDDLLICLGMHLYLNERMKSSHNFQVYKYGTMF